MFYVSNGGSSTHSRTHNIELPHSFTSNRKMFSVCMILDEGNYSASLMFIPYAWQKVLTLFHLLAVYAVYVYRTLNQWSILSNSYFQNYIFKGLHISLLWKVEIHHLKWLVCQGKDICWNINIRSCWLFSRAYSRGRG